MSLHTPGPFEIITPEDADTKGDRFYIIRGDGKTIAALYPIGNAAESRANAQLFNAAPELLEWMKGLLDGKLQGIPTTRVLHLQQLIAKAEGK